MDSRERVIRAIKCKKPDKIPYFQATSPFDSDIVGGMIYPNLFWKPKNLRYPIQKRALKRDPTSYIFHWILKNEIRLVDEFGSIWYNPGNETIGQVVDPRVLSSWDDLKNFEIPDKKATGRMWLGKFLFRAFGKSRFRLGAVDNFFYERMQFLRGFGNILADVKRHPDKLLELGEKLADWYCWLIDQWAKIGCDGIITTDDWGTNHGTFISPKDFKSIFHPLYKQVIEHCHDHEMLFVLHSCGNIYSLIPSLIDTGVDCLQLDSPRMTGLDRLAEFGGKISYMCVADIAEVIPFKTPKEVEVEVYRMIKKLGIFNGGLIGTIYADTTALHFPPENMKAVIRAYKRFGTILN
ncbi:MAG: uroporphyrinogen decarboxylase family protein [Candidatus Helarchaeota archaeon]